jgi:hypothetical protein
MTWYITIRSDDEYSKFASTKSLVDFLAAMPEVRQTGAVAFQSAPGFPWFSIVLAACDAKGSYSVDGSFIPHINVVEIDCSDYDHAEWYDALAGRVASFLGWSAFDEHGERQIWPVA